MRLDIDDQVPTQMNNRCLFVIKFYCSSICSVANLFAQLNCYCDRLNARPVYTRQSLMETMQCKYKHTMPHLFMQTPIMQTPAQQSAAKPHLLCEAPAAYAIHQQQNSRH